MCNLTPITFAGVTLTADAPTADAPSADVLDADVRTPDMPRAAPHVPAAVRPRALSESGPHMKIATYSSSAVPPAAAIFSLAEPEKACTFTWTATEMSPVPRTLTGRPRRTAPRAARSSAVTSPPSG